MRSIFFSSNFQSELFPSNSHEKFQTYIHPSDLQYISNGEIEVAIKSITFDYDLIKSLTSNILALKTNLSYHTISSYGWDNIVSIFSIEQNTRGIRQIEFSNPTFFLTNQEKLSKSQFNIIDLRTGESPNFGFRTPTFIEVIVRERLKRMKPPFHMLIDSSCQESLKRFHRNTNMEFTIQLPKRMEFRKDWSICLKSIHFSNRFISYDKCTILIEIVKPDEIEIIPVTVFGENDNFIVTDITKFIRILNKNCADVFKFKIGKLSGKVIILCVTKPFHHEIHATFSEHIMKILGLTKTHVVFTPSKKSIVADIKPDIFATHPIHFIVSCDLVEESILAGERVQVLKYFSRKPSGESVIDQQFSNNDFLTLSLKNFDRIHIRISDLSGKTIQSDPDTPTRMQLLFLNTNTR